MDEFSLNYLLANPLAPALGAVIAGLIAALVIFYFVGLVLYLQRTKTLNAKLSELEDFVYDVKSRIRIYESGLTDHVSSISQQGTKSLSTASQIVGALEKRVASVGALIESGTLIDLEQARIVLMSDLDNEGDSVYAVVNASPIPKLGPRDWPTAIEKLLQELEAELVRVEAVSGSLKQVATDAENQRPARRRRNSTFRNVLRHFRM